MKISVSYLSSKFDKKTTIKKIEESKADFIHADLMDGKYVENKNFTITEVIDDLKNVTIPIDMHLMVKNPDKYIEKFSMLNLEYVTFHPSTSKNIKKTIELIKSIGVNVGLAINPDEDISLINDYLNDIDLVLIMSVIPGKGGQKFIDSVIKKIDDFNNKNIILSIDGGINDESIELIKDKKIDIIVSGSFICNSDNFDEQIKKIS